MNHSKQVKNIIFDLGGVLLNIDHELTSEAFRQLGFTNFDERYAQARQTGLFDRFETGMISEQEFVDTIKELATTQLSSQNIVDAWNAILMDIPKQRLQLLEQLNKDYRLFLLSNTNETHQRAFEKILYETAGQRSFSPWFEQVYYSHHLHLRKPDKAIFEYVLAQNELVAEETLFIDDSLQHVEAAKETGIQAVLLEGIEVNSLIDRLL